MPITPNLLERIVLFRLNKGPAPILDLFGAASLQTVNLANNLGVFDHLTDQAVSIEKLASILDADEDGLHALLQFLAAEGYVSETTDGYQNTPMTTRWLTDTSGTNIAPWFTFWNDLVLPFWDDQLETAVREGYPSQTIYEWFDDDLSRWKVAQEGFRAVASVIVNEVTEKITVPPDATRVLDVGGGHGLFTITLCQNHPSITATIFDNPNALDAARAEIDSAGVDDQIAVTGGDYWTDDLGSNYDIALVFNIIHAHNSENNKRLFDRINEVLKPGGQIYVLDQLAGSTRFPVGKAGIEFVGLTYLVTLGATTHPYEDVKAWLQHTGFEDISRTTIRRAGPGNTLIQARKPD